MTVPDLPNEWFARIDETPDAEFYRQPRFVQHIDDGAIAAVTDAIRRHVPPGSDVLDLMSSWVSHLPSAEELPLGRVAGLGMNADELAANPRLTEWTVFDLNAAAADGTPLPYPDASFDAALVTVSVQYLTRPADTWREVARVLRPGGTLLVSWSDRMFPTKAVRIWQETPPEARAGLISLQLQVAGGFRRPEVEEHGGPRGLFGGPDPLWIVVARTREPRQPAR